jgi:hypothetical protein
MLFVMLRLMGGLKNDWIIFYLRWSHWAIVKWRHCGGDFMYDFINVSKGKVCVYFG